MMSEAYTYSYPRPAVTVDLLALRWHKKQLEVLLIKRKNEPFKDDWALPGGFVDEAESLEDAIIRECLEETTLKISETDLIEIGSFSSPHRDPRGWTISVAFIALLPSSCEAVSGDDAKEVEWFKWSDLLKQQVALAFDHLKIVQKAEEQLCRLSLTSPKLTLLLNEPFRTRDVRFLYRQLWGDKVTPRAFKAWLRKVDLVERVGRALFKSKDHLRLPW